MTTKPVLSDVMSAGTSEVLGLGGAAAVPGIAAPVMSITGGTTDTSLTPELNGGVFTLAGGAVDTHQDTDWEIATEPTFASPTWQALASASLESITVGLALDDATSYYARARYRGATYVSDWSAALAFNTLDVIVTAPTVTAPADLATNIGETPTITSSAFAVTGGSDTHLHSDWEVASDSGFVTVVASSYDDTVNKESWTVGSGLLSVSTTYYVRVRHSGTSEGDSAWSPTISFTTAAAFFDTDARAIIDQMTTAPNTAREDRIEALVVGLKADGIWSKLDALWVMAAHDAQAARLNWMDPTGTSLTEVSSPTFTIDVGYQGNGSSSYLDTGWDPATGASQLTQNDATFAVWVSTAGATGEAYLGAEDLTSGNDEILLNQRTSDTLVRFNGTDFDSVANWETTGAAELRAISRTSSTTGEAYTNGVAEGSITGWSSTGLTDRDVFLLALNKSDGTATNESSAEISIALFGSELSSAEHANLYTRLNTYLTGMVADILGADIPEVVGLYDYNNPSTRYQEVSNPSTRANSGDRVGTLLDLSGNGNHLASPASIDRPILATSGGRVVAAPDGTDEYLRLTWSGNTSNMRVWLGIKSSDTQYTLLSGHPDDFVGSVDDGSSSTILDQNAGSPSYLVNGVAPTGTRDGLHTAVSTGSNVIVEISALNLSDPDFATLDWLHYPTNYEYSGEIVCLVIADESGGALTAGELTTIRSWMEDQTGVTLP